VNAAESLGLSYQLRTALKERPRVLRLRSRRLSLSILQLLQSWTFCTPYPGFLRQRPDSPWAEFFNRFAVSPTGSRAKLLV
jgi:hypothetical protein